MNMLPAFSMANVIGHIERFKDARIKEMAESLAYVGENAVNNMRLSGNYKDHTGNLRSSTGYVVLMDGKALNKGVQDADVGTGGGQGSSKAREFITWASGEFKQGMVLVLFAGMEYAAAVESKGYDVISSSIPLAQELTKELKTFNEGLS